MYSVLARLGNGKRKGQGHGDSPHRSSDCLYWSASGGLWKTTNGGESWMDIGHALESTAFGAIAIDPNIRKRSMQDQVRPLQRLTGLHGVDMDCINPLMADQPGIRSMLLVNLQSLRMSWSVRLILISSLLLLSNGPINMGGSLANEGIWKSSDAGNSWKKTLDLQDAYDIVLHPTNPNTVYVCIGGMQATSGIYISADQGETWYISNYGLPEPEVISRLQMDISQSDPDIMYTVLYLTADTIPYGENTVAYKSLNGGDSWLKTANYDILGGYTGGYWYDQGWYDLCIAIDPLNSNHVFNRKCGIA